jgi:hypothetical protein
LPDPAAADSLKGMGEAGVAPLRSVERIARWRALWAAIGCGLAVASSTVSSVAQEEDRGAIAEALFRAGRELMTSGDVAQACPKFAESQRLDPKPGTLMNLALCHEKAGRTASAWSEYLQAAELARRAGQSERESVARTRARALESTLAHVVLQESTTPNAAVTLDGQAIGAGAYGTAIPVDFGDHVIVVSAPGKKTATVSFIVSTAAEQQTVRVPALDDEEVASPPKAAISLEPPPVLPHRESDGRAVGRTWGYVAGGAGLALLGVGTYFGLHAFAEKNVVEDECGKVFCTSRGLGAINDMKTSEAVSTITIAAGVAAVGAGVFLLLTNVPRRPSKPALSLAPDPVLRGVRMTVTW